jgi:hypothetical protein
MIDDLYDAGTPFSLAAASGLIGMRAALGSSPRIFLSVLAVLAGGTRCGCRLTKFKAAITGSERKCLLKRALEFESLGRR